MRASHRVVASCQTIGQHDNFAAAFTAFYHAFKEAAQGGMSEYHMHSFWIQVGGRILTLAEIVDLAHAQGLLTEDGQLVETED